MSNSREISPFGALAAAGEKVKLKKTGLKILDPDLSYEEWEELLFAAAALGRMSRWWVGDLLLWGEGAYEDRFSQALSLTGLAEGTIRNILTVCKKIPVSRRRERLGISKHSVVLSFSPSEQDHWLREADKNDWTREEFRAAVDRARNPAQQSVLPASPLSPGAISTAAGSLATVREALERADHGHLTTADIPNAIQAVERASETLRVAATIPTLRDLVEALVAEATPYDPQDGGETYYLVPTATIDELRALVGEEIHV